MKSNFSKMIVLVAVIAPALLTNCKSNTDEVPPQQTCRTTSISTNGSANTCVYNDAGILVTYTNSNDVVSEFEYTDGFLSGWTNSSGTNAVLEYEAGASFPSVRKNYDTTNKVEKTFIYTSSQGYLTSMEVLNDTGQTTAKYYFEYDTELNLTRWSADLVMGPPGSPLAKDAWIIENIVTDTKANPYTKDLALQLINVGLPVFTGKTNFQSGDLYLLGGSDPLPCFSEFTYDEHENAIKNNLTFLGQVINFDYEHECK